MTKPDLWILDSHLSVCIIREATQLKLPVAQTAYKSELANMVQGA